MPSLLPVISHILYLNIPIIQLNPKLAFLPLSMICSSQSVLSSILVPWSSALGPGSLASSLSLATCLQTKIQNYSNYFVHDCCQLNLIPRLSPSSDSLVVGKKTLVAAGKSRNFLSFTQTFVCGVNE